MSAAMRPVTIDSVTTETTPSVRWQVILAVGGLLAYGDDFVVTSVRGAVGAIENTQSPFQHWLVESTVLVPVFVVAVLVALTVALRMFGRVANKPPSVLGSAFLVTGAATVAGSAVLFAHAVADYGLQNGQLSEMSMGASATSSIRCAGNCLALVHKATLDLQIRAGVSGALLLLTTNGLLLAFIVSLGGGRLALTSSRAVGRRWALPRRPADGLAVLAAAGLAGSGVIHAAVVPEHLQQWPLAGSFFAVLAVGQLAGSAGLLARPGAPSRAAGAILAFGPALLWAYSRTVGLPLGPDAGAREPVGVADLATIALEGVALAAIVLETWRPARGPATGAAFSHVVCLLMRWSITAVIVVGAASALRVLS